MNKTAIRISAGPGALLIALPAMARDLTFWSWRQKTALNMSSSSIHSRLPIRASPSPSKPSKRPITTPFCPRLWPVARAPT
ncbi:hypothetical protein N8D56_00075 [Devosia sp. A8/3-2]|nr:hypothetical protein N8D56_00075 [Devosia sp. A8/3-2]